MAYIHCWNDTRPNIPEFGTRTLALYVHSPPGLSLDNVPCIVKLRGNLFTLLNIEWTVNLSSRSLCLTGSPRIEQENLCHLSFNVSAYLIRTLVMSAYPKKMIFLFLNGNISCGYTKEPSQ